MFRKRPSCAGSTEVELLYTRVDELQHQIQQLLATPTTHENSAQASPSTLSEVPTRVSSLTRRRSSESVSSDNGQEWRASAPTAVRRGVSTAAPTTPEEGASGRSRGIAKVVYGGHDLIDALMQTSHGLSLRRSPTCYGTHVITVSPGRAGSLAASSSRAQSSQNVRRSHSSPQEITNNGDPGLSVEGVLERTRMASALHSIGNSRIQAVGDSGLKSQCALEMQRRHSEGREVPTKPIPAHLARPQALQRVTGASSPQRGEEGRPTLKRIALKNRGREVSEEHAWNAASSPRASRTSPVATLCRGREENTRGSKGCALIAAPAPRAATTSPVATSRPERISTRNTSARSSSQSPADAQLSLPVRKGSTECTSAHAPPPSPRTHCTRDADTPSDTATETSSLTLTVASCSKTAGAPRLLGRSNSTGALSYYPSLSPNASQLTRQGGKARNAVTVHQTGSKPPNVNTHLRVATDSPVATSRMRRSSSSNAYSFCESRFAAPPPTPTMIARKPTTPTARKNVVSSGTAFYSNQVKVMHKKIKVGASKSCRSEGNLDFDQHPAPQGASTNTTEAGLFSSFPW